MQNIPAKPAVQNSAAINRGQLQCESPSKRNKGMEIMFLGTGKRLQKKRVYEILAHNRN